MLTLDHQASDGRGRSEPVMGRIAGVVLGHTPISCCTACVFMPAWMSVGLSEVSVLPLIKRPPTACMHAYSAAPIARFVQAWAAPACLVARRQSWWRRGQRHVLWR